MIQFEKLSDDDLEQRAEKLNKYIFKSRRTVQVATFVGVISTFVVLFSSSYESQQRREENYHYCQQLLHDLPDSRQYILNHVYAPHDKVFCGEVMQTDADK